MEEAKWSRVSVLAIATTSNGEQQVKSFRRSSDPDEPLNRHPNGDVKSIKEIMQELRIEAQQWKASVENANI